jgi:hypothetical protein
MIQMSVPILSSWRTSGFSQNLIAQYCSVLFFLLDSEVRQNDNERNPLSLGYRMIVTMF